MTRTGEEHAWGVLSELDREDVCRRAGTTRDDVSGTFSLSLFGQEVLISTERREILARSPQGSALLDGIGGHAGLAVLWYLIGASDVPLSGRLVKPGDLAGGEIYLRGTHVLPLDRIAVRYGSDPDGFLSRGRGLGGEPLQFADASVRLYPFPRVASALLLWVKDSEFAARSSLLFDSTCTLHLPVDIIWSTAMMCTLAML